MVYQYPRQAVPKVNPATILSDLRTSIRNIARMSRLPSNDRAARSSGSYQQQAQRDHNALVRATEISFAALNGWKVSDRAFRLSDIGSHGAAFVTTSTAIFDHPIFFRSAGRCCAIAGQPYATASRVEDAEEVAAQHGLSLHMPNTPLASIHYPGGTRFLLFTAPGHEVVWLPEQSNGWANPSVFKGASA